MDEIVIIGAGLSAAKAAESLREEGFVGELTMVGEERHRPYERPPLSKEFLTGQSAIDNAFVFGADWFVEHDVRLRSGAPARRLDLEASRIGLDTGETLGFDALVLATGATPRVLDIPGSERAHYLRTIEDAERVKRSFEDARSLVTIGGGWIGLEVAAAARGAGLDVTVVEAGELPLQHALGERLARHVSELHLSHGVGLRTRTEVEEVLYDGGRTRGVRTADETIPADIVVVAAGAVPNTGLAEGAGLRVDDGVLADERLRTSDARVFAIGDLANAHNTLLGTRLRVEHWDNAQRQGELVGKTVLGGSAVYDWAPYFFTDQFEFSMEYVGHGSPEDQVEIRGDLDAQEFIAYWLDADDRLTAAMNVGIWDVNDTLRSMIGTRIDRSTLTDLR
ncbi:NAD(P)/FAD-dependent oxidoreductase [Aeromicrobium piscarium]|uniref:Ferredoxin reductase n=1 Tax=Aeromicrobium piscarium TaxID=2590901 RepID=A0A554S9Y8_9ACTN|nr:FAD-dependent oxidoreductase [Aeromicrobium piscarium]TSD63143.1 ferredoxin reductase [Aeromicrobium piscarium]